MKIKKIIDKLVEFCLILSFLCMISSVILQVFTRFFMTAPSWTEEAARIFFIFSVVFGAGLAIRNGAYVYLDFFLEKFNPYMQHRVNIMIKTVVLFIGLLLFYYSVQFIQLGTRETSPSLEIKMSYVFSSMLILGVLIIYYGTLDLFQAFRKNKT